MRQPQYVSPTSISKWTENPQGYYLRYLSDAAQPDEPQSQAMAVGSAFDAFVKSFLYEHLFGNPGATGNDARFSKDAIFEEQVEPHNRDFARLAGDHCLTMYRTLGALDGLMLDLGKVKGSVKFEMDVRGTVSHGKEATVRKVPFRVKPDLHYVNEHGAFVIHDWKVNGYYADAGRSPTQGFVRARRSGKMPWTHDDCDLGTDRGILINKRKGLECFDPEWGRQCAIGAWACGAQVGSDFIATIHQLACRPGKLPTDRPKITVAEHAAHVSGMFQEATFEAAALMWSAVSDKVHAQECQDPKDCRCPLHVFRHLSLADSIALCANLDKKHEVAAATHGQFINPILDD